VTQIKTKPLACVDVDADDIFVLVLVPKNAFLETPICGRTGIKWVQDAASGLTSATIEISKGDDIMGLVKKHAQGKKYCAVIYADTPLVTRENIDMAVGFLAAGNHDGVQMPRGWAFLVERVHSDADITPVAVPNMPEDDFIVAYNCAQIALITTFMRTRINEKHMENGVFISDPYNVYIDADVKIGSGTRIGPGVVLRGATEIGPDCKLTNFVEIKKSIIGKGTKISHMSYVGDAIIGENCNIGCGVVFCNFDGKEKHETRIGNNVFVGSNTNLVAPLQIGDNAFIAAGSTITNDVPASALALARARQAIKENWRTDDV
jgi:bifunctional N-acetylglucosamine-1-phosphate-uridyltransferase/glucosamine-1-phosphate-acetyltransferase GlmU-like protein